jgi:hypothetical protein
MHLRRTLLNMLVEFQDWRASVVVKLIFFRVMVVTSLLKRVYCAEREREIKNIAEILWPLGQDRKSWAATTICDECRWTVANLAEQDELEYSHFTLTSH